MVHVRINEREANPNPFINFITPLSMPGAESPYTEEDARQLLRALAAQVRPIMKSHGFTVNSFEEVCCRGTTKIGNSPLTWNPKYEYNRVFAGRNWNAGETIGEWTCCSVLGSHSCECSELVLRRQDGTFEATPWLLGTLCHEVCSESDRSFPLANSGISSPTLRHAADAQVKDNGLPAILAHEPRP